MKKVFMIGRFNTVFQDINDYLDKHFQIQVCVDNLEMVKGMLKLNQPDLVIVSLIGLDKYSDGIFSELRLNHEYTPVVCIGTETEQAEFAEFFKGKQFHALKRPISNSKILECVNELLQISNKEEKEAITETKAERKCILLVDDNAMQLRVLNEMLKNKYDVMMATSGMKALTLIGKRIPDIIFLDYEMPVCDGKMTLQMIRELDEAKNIPVVFLTGVSDKEHIKAVLGLHPAGYLLKPANADTMFETLHKILGE